MSQGTTSAKPPPLPPEGDDGVSVIIPYRNPYALTAYYLGIFSLIPCLGVILGLVAFVLGIKGLEYARKHEHARGRVHAWVGIVIGGLSLLAHLILLPLFFGAG